MNNSYLRIQNYLFILLLIVFMVSCTAPKQSTTTENNKDEPTTLLEENPQIAEYIRHIYQDKNGNFWFGTNKHGVAHFNGDSLVYFSFDQGFNGRQITGIIEDHEKNIWFATLQSIVKYDWSTTENGEKAFTNYSIRKHVKTYVWSIFVDSKGTIWAGAKDGVVRFNGTEWEYFELPYKEEEGFPAFLTGVRVFAITEDQFGHIWFGTDRYGIIQYDDDNQSYLQYTTEHGLAGNSIFSIMEDSKGNLWIGTSNGGLSRFDGEIFTNYTETNSIGNNEVCIVYEDSKGNIWLSSEGFGVYRLDGEIFTNYSVDQGLGVKAVQTILEDNKGEIWVGGGGGLYRLDEPSFINVTKNGPWE